MSAFQDLIVEYDAPTAKITLNRPTKHNAMTIGMQNELVAALAEIGKRNDISVIVLTGAGPTFCAGRDVKELVTNFTDDEDHINLPGVSGPIAKALQATPQVVVAMVNGPAIGEGVDVALMCDLVVAAEDAYFVDLHLARGLVPGAGCWTLPRHIGAKRAAEMLLLCEKISAEQAREFGLINRTATGAELASVTQELTARAAAMPPLGLRLTKQALQKGIVEDLAATTEFISFARSVAAKTHETHDGGMQFLNKRESA